MFQKSILFCLALCLFILQAKSQIVSSESFNVTTFPPTGWLIKPDLGATGNIWRRSTNGTNPTCTPHSGAGMAQFRSRNAAANTKQILVSRPIDYTLRGTSAANLSLWMFRDSLLAANQDSLCVWVNSSDTLNGTAIKLGTIVRNRSIAIPDTQAVNGWYHYTFAVPVTFTGGTTTRFIFEGTSQSATVNAGANIFVDDIQFDEFPALCTGTPNVGNILNNNPLICGGPGAASLGLTAPITGFLGISYTWEQSASAAGPWTATGTNAATLTIPLITTSTYYRCTVNCSYSSTNYVTPIDSIVVSTNTPPTVTITPASAVFCAGTTGVHLQASGAVTYSWLPATGLNTATGDSVIASPTVNTQYIVKGTAANGCTDTAAVNVVLNAGPNVAIAATPSDTVCAGSQVILNSVPGGVTTGNTYLWSDGKLTRRDTLIVNTDTTLSVVVTNAQGCSHSDTITVYATPPSVANFGYTNTGNTFNFHDSSTAAGAWTWTFGDGNGSSSQNPTYTYSAPGTYTVTLIISGTSCNNDTITKVIVIMPEGIQDLQTMSGITYYPNPVQDQLTLKLNDHSIERVHIKNALGQTFMTQENSTISKSMTLSVSTLKSGIYFAEAISEGRTYVISFLKN